MTSMLHTVGGINIRAIELLILSMVSASVVAVIPVRLGGAGATTNRGRVEILYNNIWGTVCDDNFDSKAARVVCRGLDFNYGGTPINTTEYGPGNGPIWLDNFQCEGDEFSLDQCLLSGWNNSDCNQNEDAVVECTLLNSTDGIVRIISPPELPGSGYVEVSVNGSWGAVCDNNWNINNAKVVCGMLFFNQTKASAGAPVAVENVWTNVTKTFVLDSVDCQGTEYNILDCGHVTSSSNCDQNNKHHYAKVTCVDLADSPSSAPIPTLTCNDASFTANFSRQENPDLLEQHFTQANNGTTCNLQKSTNDDTIMISFRFDDCGTFILVNSSHIIYVNELKYETSGSLQPGYPSMVTSYSILLRCEFRKSQNTSNGGSGIKPITEQVTQVAPGEYRTRILFYKDKTFGTPIQSDPLELVPGEWLYVAVVLDTSETNLKIVVQSCHATPDANPNNPVRYPLINNKCPYDQTLSYFPVNTTMFGFRYKTFKFLDYDYVYLHCDVIVCLANETTNQCDSSCNNPSSGRRRRRHAPYRLFHIRSSPMYFVSEIYRGEQKTNASVTVTQDHLFFVSIILFFLNCVFTYCINSF